MHNITRATDCSKSHLLQVGTNYPPTERKQRDIAL